MHSLKLVIADDEPLARERLRTLLSGDEGVEVVAEAGNGSQVLDACAVHQPHAVLLDIAMPGMDGLEVARRLAGSDPATAVVFCTAYDEHALSAFEAAAIDYLVKPVRPERLATALDRVRAFLAGRSAAPQRRTQLCARLRGSLRVIPLQEVRYLQAEEKYVVVHHSRGEDLIEESLRSLEEEFGDLFVRIHRNCLVARRELAELRRSPDGHVQALLRSGGAPLEVSRRCVPQLRQALQQP
ncbi:LytR/AlgR family response regulator transcription factor [Pseudoxanthomonas suwonensis]|jgi:Response regulator of the LytR/AlgR family|uniref:LytR/AlgR family response regulator transcription factor n=1 Tax=Pseudoxanthomonas suwonensis TaxID=314722 RepID=UPI00138F6C6C|nr:LytTR family DNA-binding domain-containing protein [Pseudoxanthomonas suwonensis]KAF1700084.1 DNA-binding response regulator [Pseudoxanthomonas suwonensis]